MPVTTTVAAAGPFVDLPTDRGIHGAVEEHVRARPQQCAVVDAHGRELTYEQLWERSSALAAALRQHGVRPRHRVAVALDRSLDLIVALLAIARSGATYLPLDPSAPAERVSFVCDESEIAVVVCAADCAWPLPADLVRLTSHGHDPATPGVTASVVEAAPGDAEDPLYIAYTSGSTGQPKGVVVPHRAVLRLVTEAGYCPIEPGDRVAQLANPAFDATTFEVWSTLAAGATIVILPPVVEIAIGEWGPLLQRERVDTMFLTTAVFNVIARGEPAAFASMGSVLFGGEAADLEAVRCVLEARPPRRLVNVYGPTETTTFATSYECTHESLEGVERIPIGFPLQNTTLHVLDERLSPVAPGGAGELCIGGPGVALGYLHRPELTARRFVAERSLPGHDVDDARPAALVYRTGDRVRQGADGAIEFLGRVDRQVKLRGYRIELEEIERAIAATGLVSAPVVEMIGDGISAHLAAFVAGLADAGAPADLPAELSAALSTRLPSYMVPARWIVLAQLPLTGTGKIDRARLLADLEAGATTSPGPGEDATREVSRAPRGRIADRGGPGRAGSEAAVCEAVRELLELAAVAPGDNFFDLGGNSIVAIQLAARLGEQFGADVAPTDVLLTGSLAELADRVGAVAAGDSGSRS